MYVAINKSFKSTKDTFEGGVHNSHIEELNSLATTISCLFKVYGPMKLQAVPVSSILTKCVHIPMKIKTYDFIIPTKPI